MIEAGNVDRKTVDGFGDEWTRFQQDGLSTQARQQIFNDYFRIFPWQSLPPDAIGADMGCGSGRWAMEVAPRVGRLLLVDASHAALNVARKNLSGAANVDFHEASIGELPMADASLDFAYSLGVLHHMPDTFSAIRSIFGKLKPGAPFLVYLYYRFDNRGPLFRGLWWLSDAARRVVSRLPHAPRYVVSQIIAALVYYPLSRMAGLASKVGISSKGWPLSYYADKPFYVLRTDALDRFGTRLEQRFTRREIEDMLLKAGFVDVEFSDAAPYWCAVARKPAR